MERDVVKACLSYLRVVGWVACRTNTAQLTLPGKNGTIRVLRTGMPGWPDITGHTPDGKALYVECKWGKGRLSDEQLAFQERAVKAGCVHIVAYDLDDLIAGLGKHGYA